jgi:hypothetical protein
LDAVVFSSKDEVVALLVGVLTLFLGRFIIA